MSQFIVPLSNLPSITAIADKRVTSKSVLSDVPFADVLKDAVDSMVGAGETKQTDMYNLAMGQTDDLHTVAIDAVKSSTAVSFVSGLASAAIRAYNELMRMNI